MTKYNVLVSYVVEAEDKLQAIFALNKSLYPLSESEIAKFDAFHVEEVSSMIPVICRSCFEPIESMWLNKNDIATCVDCGGE
jgi:hypothetical protein